MMKSMIVILAAAFSLVGCRVRPAYEGTPQKPGERRECVGGGCSDVSFGVTIRADGRVNVDNINVMLPVPEGQATTPNGEISLFQWLKSVLSYDSTVDRPGNVGGSGSGGNAGTGTGSGEGNSSGNGSTTVGQGSSGSDGDTPFASTENYGPPQGPKFENSELGKMFYGTWKGINLVFGEVSGQNRKKREEASKLNDKIKEIRVLENEAAMLLDSMNSNSASILSVVRDLSNESQYDLTGNVYSNTADSISRHNIRANRLKLETDDIPEPVEVPSSGPVYDTPDLKSIEQARQYRDYVSRKVEAGPESFKPIGRQLVAVADSALDYSETAYRAGDKQEGDFAKELAVTALDTALSLTPGVGFAKDIYEASTGKSLVTGKKLSDFERTMAVVGVLTVGYGSKLALLGKAAALSDIFKAGKSAEGIAEVAAATSKAGDIVEAAARIGVKDKAVIDEVASGLKEGLPCRLVQLNIIPRFFKSLVESTAYASDCLPGTLEEKLVSTFGSVEKASTVAQSMTSKKVNWPSDSHALERLLDRNITKEQADKVLDTGKRYFDIKNESIVTFADRTAITGTAGSTKLIGIAVDPGTMNVKTVLRESRPFEKLPASRFLELK